jgi:hypothetical protein
MSRNAAGVYTLPSAYNPVVANTTILAEWGNTTLSDVATALTDSLDRYGRGSMQAQFKAVDGTLGLPGITFGDEATSGFSRASAGEIALSILGTELARFTAAGIDVDGDLSADSLTLSGALIALSLALTGQLSVAANTSTSALKVYQLGTGNVAEFGDATDPDSSPTVIDSVGIIIVGHTASFDMGASQGRVQVVGATGLSGIRFNNANSNGQSQAFGRSRGSGPGVFGAVSANDGLVRWNTIADDGTALIIAGYEQWSVDAAVSTGIAPTRYSVHVMDAAGVIQEALRINSFRALGLSGANFGVAGQVPQSAGAAAAIAYAYNGQSAGTHQLGYLAGAGGTVTQATSISTGVTLNKQTGLITMFAALAAASGRFFVTNSLVTANSTVIVHYGGSTTDGVSGDFWCAGVQAGGFYVGYSGTTASPPPVRFTILDSVNT